MSKTDEEIAANQGDEEDTDDTEDEEEDDDADDAEDSDDDSDDDEDYDSDDDEEDEEEDDDSDDEDDSDEDSKKPLSKKERKQLAALQKRQGRSEGNRRAAARRKSDKGSLSKKRSEADGRIDSLEKTAKQLIVAEKKRNFGHANNLAPDEVDALHKITGRLKRKDLKDPVVKGALDGLRSSKRLKGNLPSSKGSRPFRPNSKEMKNATPQERRSAFTQRRQGLLAEKREQGR